MWKCKQWIVPDIGHLAKRTLLYCFNNKFESNKCSEDFKGNY